MGSQKYLQRQYCCSKAMLVATAACCLTAGFPISCSAFTPTPFGLRTCTTKATVKLLLNTRYTIDDSVCPPTEEKVLRDLIYRSCSSIDLFLEKKPIAAHTAAAFEAIREFVDPKKEIVLDSGCGTGRSTVLLGQLHPEKQVIGVDRSFVRLNRNENLRNENDGSADASLRPFQSVSSNTLLVRAELADFWRCCLNEGWTISHHYLLYPNPYPTKARIKQRWYGHPAFPLILQLGGDIMVRSNWKGFLEEFATSVEHASNYLSTAESTSSDHNYALRYVDDAAKGPVERTEKNVAWTNFEKKYDVIGEPTYELLLRPTSKSAKEVE